jgi:hypothetical protein
VNYALHNVVGNIGVLLIVGTYFLVQIGKMPATQAPYIVANAVGAALLLYSLYFEFNLSAFLIEAIWLLISIVGLVRVWLERRAVRRQLPMGKD